MLACRKGGRGVIAGFYGTCTCVCDDHMLTLYIHVIWHRVQSDSAFGIVHMWRYNIIYVYCPMQVLGCGNLYMYITVPNGEHLHVHVCPYNIMSSLTWYREGIQISTSEYIGAYNWWWIYYQPDQELLWSVCFQYGHHSSPVPDSECGEPISPPRGGEIDDHAVWRKGKMLEQLLRLLSEK